MKIRFGKNDVVDTKELNEAVADAYVPEKEEGYDWLDQFLDACYTVSSGGEKHVTISVNSQGMLTITTL